MDVSKANVFPNEAVVEKTGSDVCDSTVKIIVLETITRVELAGPISDVKGLVEAGIDVSDTENASEVPEPRFPTMGMLFPAVVLISVLIVSPTKELTEISPFVDDGS